MRDALEVVDVNPPDVVVLDIDLGTGSSLEAIPRMLSRAHEPRVLVLSMQAIATRLLLSVRTVETHHSHAMT